MNPADALADAHRREWARVLAATMRVTHDLDLAEDAVHDAYAQALDQWTRIGIPGNPSAWLVTTARRRAIDTMRRNSMRRERQAQVPASHTVVSVGDTDLERMDDERLRLVFLCCHPALSHDAQAALTLRLVCGVDTPSIARAFLVPTATMAARITRAKKKITTARIPFRLPDPDEYARRLPPVLSTVHLLYTTAHTAPHGDTLTRDDLADQALDLALMLHELLPHETEVTGLLGLILITHARRSQRTDHTGRLLRLHEQDRTQWDRATITEAEALIRGALTDGPPGIYTLQAAIAAAHATAPTYETTNWQDILDLHDALYQLWPNPAIALNRTIAVSHVHGPQAALDHITALEQAGQLAGYHYLPAVKAHLLDELGRTSEALAAYRTARDLATNPTEIAFLETRLGKN